MKKRQMASSPSWDCKVHLYVPKLKEIVGFQKLIHGGPEEEFPALFTVKVFLGLRFHRAMYALYLKRLFIRFSLHPYLTLSFVHPYIYNSLHIGCHTRTSGSVCFICINHTPFIFVLTFIYLTIFFRPI